MLFLSLIYHYYFWFFKKFPSTFFLLIHFEVQYFSRTFTYIGVSSDVVKTYV